jgi:hypothetical protein
MAEVQEKSKFDWTYIMTFKIGPLFMVSVAIVLIITGAILLTTASKANSNLVGNCNVNVATDKTCSASCYWKAVYMQFANVECSKSYKLSQTKNALTIAVFKPTTGFKAMIITGAVIFGVIMLGLMSYYACPYVFCYDKYIAEDELDDSDTDSNSENGTHETETHAETDTETETDSDIEENDAEINTDTETDSDTGPTISEQP